MSRGVGIRPCPTSAAPSRILPWRSKAWDLSDNPVERRAEWRLLLEGVVPV